VAKSRKVQVEKPAQYANPLAAAYASGRLLNNLAWHMQQAWLLLSNTRPEGQRHFEESLVVFRDLSDAIRQCTPDRARQTKEDRIRDECLEWQGVFGGILHRGDLEEEDATYRRHCGEARRGAEIDFLAFYREACIRLAQPVLVRHRNIRRKVCVGLPDRALLALSLGEVVDRGLRQHDVYRWIPHQQNLDVRETHLDSFDDENPPPFLARGGPEAGELGLSSTWHKDVGQRLAELKLTVSLPKRRYIKRKTIAHNVTALVAKVDHVILDRLSGISAIKKPPANEARDEWIYKRCCKGIGLFSKVVF
jgi:hypothetical protein